MPQTSAPTTDPTTDPTPDSSTTAPSAVDCAEAVVVAVSRLRRRIRVVGESQGLSPSQRSVLSRLREADASASDLAAAERVRPQSMAATVSALLELELVRSSADPLDGRRRVLSLTDEGAAWVRGNRRVKQEWLAAALEEHCDDAERATVVAAMAILDRVTGS